MYQQKSPLKQKILPNTKRCFYGTLIERLFGFKTNLLPAPIKGTEKLHLWKLFIIREALQLVHRVCINPDVQPFLELICCCLVAKLCPTFFVTPWTAACQTPLSMGFSRKEYWNVQPCPSPGDLSDPGCKVTSPALAGGFFTTEPPGRPQN